ncbi:DUF3883 domain-containing protein [Mycolicibacterium boenickei]|nr:DUF3883 domain-containing protein [Mycolicibacterium boenickei]
MANFREIKPNDVLKALEVIDDPAQRDFVDSLGFQPAREFRMVYRGKLYDSKKVIGVAHGVATGTALNRKEVTGGESSGAAYMLRRRGFFVDDGPLFTLDNLRVDATHGKQSPYQYIVLLWAMARARDDAPQFVNFSGARKELAALLKPFALAKTAPDPAMPWGALGSKPDWWQLQVPDGMLTASDADVKQLNLVGGLADDIYRLRSHDDDFARAAVEVIGKHVGVDDRFRDLIEALGLDSLQPMMPPLDAEGNVVEDGQSSGAAAPSGRPTRMQDPLLRAAIERHSVDDALAFYDSIGGVDAIELGKPYDIKVTVDGVERHCEVKGSTMLIDAVELTINEVKHGKTYPHVDLIVVDGIEVARDPETGEVLTSGGRRRVWMGWKLRDEALSPTKFAYLLPPVL